MDKSNNIDNSPSLSVCFSPKSTTDEIRKKKMKRRGRFNITVSNYILKIHQWNKLG